MLDGGSALSHSILNFRVSRSTGQQVYLVTCICFNVNRKEVN